MREYDEKIRLYTPMLQRIIVLGAVIIAVPVVLWTITAFVRAYVAPPQLPTFRPLAANQAGANQIPVQGNVQVAAQTANTATDARVALIEIKKPATSDQPQAGLAMSAPAMSAPLQQAAAPVPSAPVNAALASPAATTTPAAPPPVAAAAAPVAVPPPPFAATRSTPSAIAAPANIALANVTSAPAYSGADTRPANVTPAAEQSAANDGSAEDLPPGTPLTGKIPLPARRPHIAALTAVAANTALAAGPAPMPSGIPLPRARPAAAPESVSDTPIPTYDPSQIH